MTLTELAMAVSTDATSKMRKTLRHDKSGNILLDPLHMPPRKESSKKNLKPQTTLLPAGKRQRHRCTSNIMPCNQTCTIWDKQIFHKQIHNVFTMAMIKTI